MSIRARLVVGAAAATVIVLASAAPAWAHVTVDPSSAPKGAEITLGFRVPNEQANASTTEIQIFFPSAHPILGVDPQTAAGWTDRIVTAPLNPPVVTDDGPLTDYVSEVDWYGGAVKPAHFQEFYVLAQQLPTDTNQVAFKALQTYSNGTVVRWIQSVVPGQAEPDHPTPILQLTNPSGAASGSGASSSSGTTSVIALVLGALALVLGVSALILVLRGRRVTSRRPTQPSVGPTSPPAPEAGENSPATNPPATGMPRR